MGGFPGRASDVGAVSEPVKAFRLSSDALPRSLSGRSDELFTAICRIE